ncbi:hypothetical protein [Chondromyces crocatus]|nr:hypothetical protein [Chondromyces crocatus]
MDTDGQCWRRMRAFDVRMEPPDLFQSRMIGDLEEADVHVFHDLMYAERSRHGRLIWLADCSRLGDLDPGARRTVGQRDFGHLFWAVIIHGANFRQRVLVTMMFHAARLLSRDKDRKDLQLHFVPDEAAGLCLVEELRLAAMPPPRNSEVRPVTHASSHPSRRGTRVVS